MSTTSRKGSGSVRELEPGVWELRLSLGLDAGTGKYRRISKRYRGTEAQALRELERVRKAELAELADRKTGLSVAELLDRHLDALRLEGCSPSTITGYTWRVRDVLKPAIGSLGVDELTTAHLDKLYVDELARGVKPATIRQHHTVISGALTRAGKKGWLGDRPVNVARMATPPAIPKRRPEPLPVEKVRELWQAAEAKDPARATFLRVAAATGLRRGEVCGLRWSDLRGAGAGGVELFVGRAVVAVKADELDAETVSIARRRNKTERLVAIRPLKVDRPRNIALDPGTELALTLHRGRMEARAELLEATIGPDAYIFSDDPDASRPWHPDNVSAFVYRLGLDSGIEQGRILHGLRHFVATELLAAGVDPETAAHRLGWSSTKMLLDTYGHVRAARDHAAARQMGDLLADS